MADDVVARICRPVKDLSPRGVSATAVVRECSMCYKPVWYNTDQANPLPELEEVLVCFDCAARDPELREQMLDPAKWVGDT
jgi:hypothetical protein